MSDYIARMRAKGLFPAVLRYARMGPAELRKMIKHARPEVRKKLAHVDAARTHLNRTSVGSIDDLERLFDLSREMAEFNRNSNVLGLRALGRPTDADVARDGGLKDPWDPKALPWRQVVAAVNHEWAVAADDCPDQHVLEYLGSDGDVVRLDKRKCLELEKAVDSWMEEQHGEALIYGRWDWDEQGPHGHYAIAHAHEYEPTGRYSEGRWHWKPSVHPFFRNECDDQGKKLRSGYEIAQDSIGDFFARDDWKHMRICRGEPRAAQCRDALNAVADIVEEVEAEALFGEVDLPSGSANAKAMFALKKKIAETVSGKGGAGKVRKDETQRLAIDWLEILGVITADEKHEASTRRARQALLEKHSEALGTATEIIANPDAAADAVLARARAEKDAADRARLAADEAACIERERLDREAAERRKAAAEKARQEEVRREKKFVMKEAAMAAREENVAAREIEVERKVGWLNATLRELQTLGDSIRGAAQKLGLLEQPWVQKALQAGRRVHDLAVRKPPGLDD